MLAHGGALFLDELAEFSPSVFETLRDPLAEGAVPIAAHPLRVGCYALKQRECVRSRVCSHRNCSLKQFAEMQKVMKQMGALAKGGRLRKIPGVRGS